jgi:hypothetical protein
MTVAITQFPIIIISQILFLVGFLLLLKAFWALRTVNENGKTTVTGSVDPKLIKIGLVLIIASIAFGVVNVSIAFGVVNSFTGFIRFFVG